MVDIISCIKGKVKMKIMCSDDISSLLMRIFNFHLLSGGGGIASLRPDPQVSGFVDEERVMLTAGVSDNDDVVIKVLIIIMVLTVTL